MLALALIIFVGPLIGGLLSFAAGVQLWRGRKVEGPIVVLLTSLLAFLALWELRYDLGFNLPDLTFLPSGADLERTLVVLAAAILATLFFGALRWPSRLKGRWMAFVAIAFWALIIAAGFVLAGIDFRH
ncbi:hypothetical protein [uncultured Shimia sp.]|uniref:hypothetical protein n=1 Tax=uncultured Shimia sp. TaxID=573152 RepID=UPI0025EA7F93|nr:hypothetical protein [uncultured Shimia sp.]